MELNSKLQMDVTQRKLRLLEERYEASQREPDADAYYKVVSRRSLKRMINQMKEEIARFEARATAKT